MSSKDQLLENEKKLSVEEQVREARRKYFKKSLILYGFTEEQAELLLQSVDEFVKEEKGLTEEAKEALYKV